MLPRGLGLAASSEGSGSISVPDLGARRRREAVVEQVRGLLPRRDRLAGAAHQHRHQPAAVVVGGADEGLTRVVGVAGLAAHRAGVVVEQLVVVLHRIADVAAAGKSKLRVATMSAKVGFCQAYR